MGSSHARDCSESELVELAALCDVNPDKLEEVASQYDAKRYTDADDMMAKADLEAVIIATPHYDHTPLSISALERGIHVMCEKPVGVHVKDVRRMIDAYEKAKRSYPDLRFGAMFQQRTMHSWRKVKEMIDGGILGRMVRATWIVTSWFRTQYYYDTGSWRATWAGEGGGVLLNQCPHNLDLYQWLLGMPERVHGFASIGKYHDIEVEDEVTGVFHHANGMVGHLITTTAESPGTNRLELVGENGRLIIDGNSITFDRNEQSMIDYSNTAEQGFGRVPYTTESIEVPGDEGGLHRTVNETFMRAVREGSPLVAEAPEGMGSVALANAILMSHFTGKTVDLPLNGDAYESLLQDLISRSSVRKDDAGGARNLDLSDSF